MAHGSDHSVYTPLIPTPGYVRSFLVPLNLVRFLRGPIDRSLGLNGVYIQRPKNNATNRAGSMVRRGSRGLVLDVQRSLYYAAVNSSPRALWFNSDRARRRCYLGMSNGQRPGLMHVFSMPPTHAALLISTRKRCLIFAAGTRP